MSLDIGKDTAYGLSRPAQLRSRAEDLDITNRIKKEDGIFMPLGTGPATRHRRDEEEDKKEPFPSR